MTTGEADLVVTKFRLAGRLGSAGAGTGSSAALGITISIVACLLFVALAITLVVLGFSNGSESDGGDDDGGPRRRGPEPPSPGPPDADPPWWPEFEREFAIHAESVLACASDQS